MSGNKRYYSNIMFLFYCNETHFVCNNIISNIHFGKHLAYSTCINSKNCDCNKMKWFANLVFLEIFVVESAIFCYLPQHNFCHNNRPVFAVIAIIIICSIQWLGDILWVKQLYTQVVIKTTCLNPRILFKVQLLH